jgi:hypothetical protein
MSSIGDVAKMAFDSTWGDVQHVLVAGSANPSTSPVALGDGFYQLATWTALGYIPLVWVYGDSKPFCYGRYWDIDGSMPGFRTRVWDGTLGVRSGLYSGYYCPNKILSFVVFKTRALS